MLAWGGAGTKGAPDSSDCPLSNQGDAALAMGPPGPRGAKGDMVSRSGPCIAWISLLCMVWGDSNGGWASGSESSNSQMVRTLQPLTLASDP